MKVNQLLAALSFAITTIAIPFLTKTVVNSYKYPFPFFILTLRFLIGLLAVEFLRTSSLLNVNQFSLRRGWLFLLPSVVNAFQSFCTITAMKGMTVPMFGAIRQCIPLVNLILMVLVLRKPIPSPTIIVSILMITVGSLIAGLSDASYDGMAYLACISSVVGLGIYTTLVQKATEHQFTVAEIFYLNCYNSLPFFVFGCILTDELQGIFQYNQYSDPMFCFWLLLTAIAGNFLTLSMFLCTHLNSALITSLVGVLKTIPQTLFGLFAFGGFQFTAVNTIGLTLNLIGGCTFAYGKNQEVTKMKSA